MVIIFRFFFFFCFGGSKTCRLRKLVKSVEMWMKGLENYPVILVQQMTRVSLDVSF